MKVETILSKELLKLGFKRKEKRTFYLVKDDIIGLIVLERPSDFLYVQYAVMPLFLPCPGYIHYPYGMRLGNMYRDLPSVYKDSSDELVQVFCCLVISHIKNEILPFLYKHSTAASLNTLVRSWFNRNLKYLFCTPEKRMRLLFYSGLCIKDYKNAIKNANKYILSVLGAKHIMEAVKEQRISPVRKIIAALEEGDYDTVEQMLRTNREENLALFIETKK